MPKIWAKQCLNPKKEERAVIRLIKRFVDFLRYGSVGKLETNYKYKYQRHPFDDWNYFTVKADDADNQEEANTKAKDVFAKMFQNKQTVMTVFYPVI